MAGRVPHVKAGGAERNKAERARGWLCPRGAERKPKRKSIEATARATAKR